MDQTEKIAQQSNSPNPSQNNPESQKGSKRLPKNQASSSPDPHTVQNQHGQNSSMNGSRAMSQTGSQMDQQIMRGISKYQKRRYTNLLEGLGIDVKNKHSKKQEQPIQDGQNFNHQKLEPNQVPKEFRQPSQSHRQVVPFREAKVQENRDLDGGNYSLIENEQKVEKKQRNLSQRSDGSHKIQNLQNQMLGMGNQPDSILEPQIQIIPLEPVPLGSPYVKFQIQKTSEEKQPNSEQKQIHSHEDVEIDGPSSYTQANFKIDKYHQSEGQISMDNNYDPSSINKPFSDFSYDLINSIYTPVSHQRAPPDNSNLFSVENNSNIHSGQQQLATVIEEFKQIIEEQKDFEIDGPFRPEEAYQEKTIEINYRLHSQRISVEKDVEIDGPYQNHSTQVQNKNIQIDGPSQNHNSLVENKDVEIDGPSQNHNTLIQNKDVEIDGPSIHYDAHQTHEVNIDSPSSLYEAPPEALQNLQRIDSTKIQRLSQELSQIQNIPEKSEKGQRSSLHIVQKIVNQEKSQGNHQNSISNQEIRQNSFNILNPSAKIFKTQSQNNDKPNSGYPRPKKNSQTSSFQNQDLHKTAEMNHNRRKFSESSRSAGLNSVNNKVSSNKRPSQYAQGNSGSFALSQNIFDSREFNSFHQSNQRIIEIEEQFEPHDSVKMTPNGNSFSNRSEKSSIHSKRSNRFSDEMFNEKQVPPLDGLQLVRDGKEARLERKSRSSQNSNRSHHSRSASTCKKSYDDLSEIRMQKIDEKGEQLEQKSIKRSLHRAYTPPFAVDEVQGQKHEVEHEEVQSYERNHQEGDFEIDGQPQVVHFEKVDVEKRNENYSIETTYLRLQEQKIPKERKDNFTQTVSHQITIHLEQQEEEEQIFESKSVQYSTISSAPSIKTTESQKKRQRDEYLEDQRRRKRMNMSFIPAFQIQIDNPLPMEQRLDNVLIFCKEYLSGSHHSNYEKERLRELIEKNFQFFGTELEPVTDLGQRMLHDGIFAITFISFVKENKKSGMLESLMFTQFEQQVGIRTNKDVFLSQLKRVKDEREMHYNNEFEKRYKEHEERKAKEQAKKIQINTNVINQTVTIQPKPKESKVLIQKKQKKDEQKQKTAPKSSRVVSKVWEAQLIIEESNGSAIASSQTMTIDEQRDFENSPIKKTRIQDIGPKPSKPMIKQTDSVLDAINSESSYESWFAEPQTAQTKEHKKSEVKNLNLPKKRVTKKKEKKVLDVPPAIIVKSEYTEESHDQTVSQVQQRPSITKKPEQQDPVNNESQILGQKQKATKGILKGARAVRNSQQQNEKKQKRSPSKKDIEKAASKKKKHQASKEKNQQKSSPKPTKSQIKAKDRDRNSSPKYQEPDLSVTISPRNKVSIQKAVQEKVNQPKTVKFSESTKGGEATSIQKRKNPRMFDALPEEEPQQESQKQQQGKRTLRSRSKK